MPALNVRPCKVVPAVLWLVSSNLYGDEGIQFNQEWAIKYNNIDAQHKVFNKTGLDLNV